MYAGTCGGPCFVLFMTKRLFLSILTKTHLFPLSSKAWSFAHSFTLYEIQSRNCVVSLQSLCMSHLQAMAFSSYT